MNWKEKRKTGDNSMKPADDQQMTSRRPAEKPVRIFRYVAMLLMLLTLGVGQMWAAEYTAVVGVAATNSSNYTVKLNVNRQGDGNDWQQESMSKAGLTFEGKKLYITSYTNKYGGLGKMQFQYYSGGTHKGQKEPISSWTSSTHDNEILNYDSGTNGTWYSKQTVETGARVYFDASTWDETSIKLVVGHANYQRYSTLTNVTNTKLYYGSSGNKWTDAMHIGVVGNTSASDGTNWPTDISDKATEFTGLKNYGLTATSTNNAYLIVPAGDAGEQPSISYYGTAYSSLNSTQTIKYAVGINGATPTELTSGYVPADIAISSYKFSSGKYNAVDASSGSVTLSKGGSNYSATVTAARTATTTYTISNVHEDYSFLGWYSAASGGTLLSSELSYTFYPTSATTAYARFSKENNHTVTISRYCTSTSTEINNTSAKIGEVTYSSITAPEIYGYTFVNWTLESGVTKHASDALTSNPIRVITAASGTYTMQANYTEVLTTDWKVIGDNQSGGPFGDNYSYSGSTKAMSKKTGHSSEHNAYVTINVTKIPGDNYGFKVASSSADADKWGYGTGDGAYITFNRSASGVSKQVYNGSQHQLKFVPDGLGEYEFRVHYPDNKYVYVNFPTNVDVVTFGKGTGGSTVTAKYSNVSFSTGTKVQRGKTVRFTQTASTGYTFKEWNTESSGSGTRLSTSATYDRTVASTNNVYAIYTINNHNITRTAPTNGTYTIKVGTADPVSTSTTSDYNKTITLAATPNTGYHFTGWTVSKAGGGSITPSSSATANPATFTMPDDDVTVSASFAPDVYTITYKDQGNVAFSGTHVDSPSAHPTSHTYGTATSLNGATKTGYTFGGWYANSACTGDAVTSLGATAYTANITLYAKWTANNYTVTFDATTNGGSCATASKSVTYGSTYGELPVATHAANTFIGWYTTASGVGSRVTSSTTVSTAINHTLYARFESTYTINVQYKCGSVTLYPGTTVQASATSLAADISAPEVLGYSFVNWTGSNATFGNPSSATTTVNATAATTITANYNAVPTVYFKNNLGWENVYVSFNIDFVTAAGATVPKNNGKPYYKMTQLGTSDIFYCEIPSTYTANDYAGWKGNIAFDNKGFGDYSSTHTGNSNSFYQGEFLGRADFDPNATLYIPYKGDKETRNSGKYYPTGCWIQYNSNYSGYKVKVNTKVQGTGGTETVAELRTTIAGSTEFKGTVNLTSANYTYGVMLYKEYLKNSNDLWYTNVNNEANTITSATTSLPWAFQPCTDSWQRCRVKTEALGDYEITVSFATGKPMVNITYPVSVGDWRLVYKDRATWSNGVHSASWWHPSRVIKAKANAVDTVSFFVAYGSIPSVELQKCTAIDGGTGAQTWTKQGDYLSLSSITKKGVYNFKVTQTGSKVASAAYLGEYSGDFYIRTDASDGGWNNYMNGANTMTYSEYSIEHGGYTHYFMNYRHSGTSVKFVIANDYSPCISDTILGDTYTNSSEWLPAAANVRFMWDKRSNTISRAYLSGSTIVSDRFLVLEGDAKMFDENGNPLSISGLSANEMKFTDDQNWIYEATVKAQPTARIKLTAKYNNKIQYFYGKSGARSESTTELLIGGSGTDKYKVRVVYDFKTNRLIKAFIPEGTISTAMAISADLMIIREAQGDAQQINFSGDGTLSKVQTVYGAMKFNKWNVNDKDKGSGHANLGWSRYKRDLFYISFPFDVKLSDAFGFGEYGKHWIIEYYDGKGRAANGFWADSDPNWKFVLPSQRSSFTLKAFEGYILALELDEMTESSEVWEHGVEDVYVYFPSADSVKNISATTRTITIDQEGYYCSINRQTPDGDRRVKDSYWHVIGVPSFANYSSTLYDTNGGTAIDWTSTSMPYLYEWNSSDNTLSITTSANFAFKPTYSYMVQYAGASIYWNAVNVTPAAAPRRNPAYRGEYEFRMELLQNDEKVDQTYVKLSDDENVTTGFEFNYDLSKEFNKKKANIYTLIGTEQVAGNVLPLTEQTTIVPVGVKTVASGDYTFAMPDGTEGIGVTLIDNETGLRTPLGLTDYTVTLEAGTYDERFALEISPIKQTPTDIELLNGENGENGVRKVMIDGILYIVKDGKVFDARGSRVK